MPEVSTYKEAIRWQGMGARAIVIGFGLNEAAVGYPECTSVLKSFNFLD